MYKKGTMSNGIQFEEKSKIIAPILIFTVYRSIGWDYTNTQIRLMFGTSVRNSSCPVYMSWMCSFFARIGVVRWCPLPSRPSVTPELLGWESAYRVLYTCVRTPSILSRAGVVPLQLKTTYTGWRTLTNPEIRNLLEVDILPCKDKQQ